MVSDERYQLSPKGMKNMINSIHASLMVFCIGGLCVSCEDKTTHNNKNTYSDMKKNNSPDDVDVENYNREMTDLIEKNRKVYVLKNDMELKNYEGSVVAILYKGALIRDASSFDLESGDIGDNNLFSLIFDAGYEPPIEKKSDLINTDDTGVSMYNAQH
jgi:hypothetical protein